MTEHVRLLRDFADGLEYQLRPLNVGSSREGGAFIRFAQGCLSRVAPYELNEGHITYDMGESDGEHDALSDTTHTCGLRQLKCCPRCLINNRSAHFI